MSETPVSAKGLPKFPPIRIGCMSVEKLFQLGPNTWSKGAKFRDEQGKPIDIEDPTIIPASFDITGAIDWTYRNQEQNLTARIRVGMELKTTPTRWNDSPSTSYEDLMNLVRRCNI